MQSAGRNYDPAAVGHVGCQLVGDEYMRQVVDCEMKLEAVGRDGVFARGLQAGVQGQRCDVAAPQPAANVAARPLYRAQIGQIGGHHVDTACNCGCQTGQGIGASGE